jgi:hypothetical protein
MGTYSRLVSPVVPHVDIVSQSRTALDVDANSCGSFDCATFVVPIWTRKWLRWPECHDFPSVRRGILRRYDNVNQELWQVARAELQTEQAQPSVGRCADSNETQSLGQQI